LKAKIRYYHRRGPSLLARIRKALEEEKDVLLAVVFGSFVELDHYRDIDIAVYSTRKDLGYHAALASRLEKKLRRPVDVAPLPRLPPALKIKILARGVVALERRQGLYEAMLSLANDELLLAAREQHPGRRAGRYLPST
jgi:predicted nucleotidyltransferase